MCKRTLLASPIVLLAAMILLAQEGAWSASPPKVQLAQVPIVAGAPILFFSLPSELSRSVVRNIIQDDQGFLWFGKREGLWRYDGYRFIRFPSDSPDPRGAGGVYVYTLYKDRLGRLWIGFDVSLDRYDPSTGKIQQYRAPAGDPCGALGPVFQISEDREGIFWLATESGLKRLDPMTSKVTCYQHEQGDNSSIASNLVRSTLESRNGTFWVANAKGLDIFDRRTGKVTRHILWQREGIKGASVSTSLLEDHAGLLWQGSSLGGGLASIDPVTGNVTVYSFRSLVSKRNVTYGVVAVLQDDEGALWLGTDGQGILKLDRDRRHAVQYRTDPNHSDSLSNDNVAALFTDHAGSFWVSTEGGYVDRFSSSPSIFRNYRHQSGNANSLIDDFVISAYEDSHGTLWVGTERGLNRIDQRTGEVIRYESGARGLVEPFKTGVRSIVEDRNGNLWFGSRGSGLERFDPQSGQTRTYRHVPSDPNSLSEGYIACLFVDHRGTLWAATNDGLNRFDTERQQFQFYRAEVAGLVRYHSIAEDSQGALWLGSFGFGVHRFDPQTGRFTVYQNKSGDAHSLSSNRVNSVYIDRAGTLWAATYSGLNKFDPTSQSFTSYHVNDGLPSDAVFGVLEDEHGYLWLSTSAGLARFNPRSLTFTNYHLSDGLPTDLFTPLVVASKSRTGKMFFGTYSGLVTFFPSQAVDPSPVLPVILTDFRLFGVSVQVGTGPLKQPIWSTRVLTLPERSIFSFEFSAPSYSDPERNRYRYRLEGLESKWNETDSSHRYAAYSNLAPGQYLFRVQGSDSHGIWNTTGASVQIRVLAPFYRTNWFRALCVAAFLALLYGLYRVRVGQLRAQEEKFREAIESIPAMAFVALPDGNRTFVNKGWVEYTGMTVEQAAGSGWQEAVHPEDRKRVVAKWQSAMASGEPMDYEARFRRAADGQYRWFVVRVVPLRDKRGKIVKWSGTATDIEDRRRAEQLQADIAHINRVSMMGELAASISHELKQPITATMTNANTSLRWLKRSDLDLDEVRDATERIIKDGGRATEIIDRLRSLYKKSPPKRELVEVNEVVREMMTLLRGEASRQGVSVRTDLEENLPKIIADRVQLQQVLMNLMLNAIEAMKDTGGVLTVRTQVEGDGRVRISVSDTGVGLPAEKADEIFNAFVTTKEQGSGMGLAISRSIVESHGGRLWATANEGRGATFHFNLPSADETAKAPAAGT